MFDLSCLWKSFNTWVAGVHPERKTRKYGLGQVVVVKGDGELGGSLCRDLESKIWGKGWEWGIGRMCTQWG